MLLVVLLPVQLQSDGGAAQCVVDVGAVERSVAGRAKPSCYWSSSSLKVWASVQAMPAVCA